MADVTHVVGPDHTAKAVGSGDLEVLGTPVLLAWLEEATCAALDLGPDETSVGTRVEVEHRLATPIGGSVTSVASVLRQDGRLVIFTVSARDGHGNTVATGEIRRVVVDRNRFLTRVPQGG